MEDTGLYQEPSETVAMALGRDHARLHHLLHEIQLALADGERERADATLGEFEHGILCHMAVEEELLFPCLESHSSWASRPGMVMRAEHRRIEHALAQLREAIAAGPIEGARKRLTQLGELLAAHDLKEERVLYPASDEALTPAERSVIARRLHRG
jgi:regulator of cell morphogenesis and NO signaling